MAVVCALIISSCGNKAATSEVNTANCKAHEQNCPPSENCPEHPECEAHESCKKGEDCKHASCMAYDKSKG
ncbi:MAG: hypothetical protein JNJ40_12680 [Bacteroidia bacterium]|nr:hypothetical protein [Bacteroidia bacterium]